MAFICLRSVYTILTFTFYYNMCNTYVVLKLFLDDDLLTDQERKPIQATFVLFLCLQNQQSHIHTVIVQQCEGKGGPGFELGL